MAIPQIIPADIAGNMQQGWLFGEQQKQARRQEQEYERKRTDLAALRNLAPSVLQGNLADYQRAAAIDPEAAAAYQDAGDRGLRRATNVVKIMETALASKDDAAVQAAHRRVAPYLQELTGQTPPEQWDASMLPNFQAFADRVKAANSPLVNKNIPSGYQEFALMAEAAGLKPGDDDYAKAAGVRLGINARPPTGGFSFDTVDLGDGRKRPARMNPRTGTQEYYDERVGRWLQLGDGGSLDNGATSGGVNVGSGDSEVVVNIPEISPERQRQLANVASAMRANGVSDDAINRWISSVLNTDVSDRQAPPAPAQPQPYQQPAPTSSFANSGQSPARAPTGVGASRTPEEEAAAVEQAKTNVNLANASQVTQMEADRAGQIEAQKREAQRIAENRAGLAKTESTITQMQNLVGQAKRHRGRSTATGLSGALDPRNYVPGTNARDFQVLLDQIQGQAFLQAFDSLKGGGQITEVEGRKATDAIGRLNTAQSDAEFVRALKDLEDVLSVGMERAKRGVQTAPADSGGAWKITRKGTP